MAERNKCVWGVAAVIAGLTLPASAWATNGYQLIGIGAYQKSLAGAVTANPGSAQTAISNPAGIGRIGPRADFSAELFRPDRFNDFSDVEFAPGAGGGEKQRSDTRDYGVPSLGWSAPISDDRSLWFGGGFFGTSGLGVDYPVTDVATNPINGEPADFDGHSSITFAQISPTVAARLDDRLTVGAAPVIAFQSVGFQQRFRNMPNPNFDPNQQPGPNNPMGVDQNFNLGTPSNAFGAGFSLGLLYDLTPELTLGASYQSRIWFESVKWNLRSEDISGQDAQGNQFSPNQGEGTWKMGLDYPQQLAVGLAWKVTPDITLSGDIKWIEWSDTLESLSVRGPDGEKFHMDPEWDDQWVLALGAAWDVSRTWQLRAGFNYAESPIDDDYVDRNLLLPAIMETHFTFGGTVQLPHDWHLDFALMYAPENKQTQDGGPFDGATIGMDQTSYTVNIGYHF